MERCEGNEIVAATVFSAKINEWGPTIYYGLYNMIYAGKMDVQNVKNFVRAVYTARISSCGGSGEGSAAALALAEGGFASHQDDVAAREMAYFEVKGTAPPTQIQPHSDYIFMYSCIHTTSIK